MVAQSMQLWVHRSLLSSLPGMTINLRSDSGGVASLNHRLIASNPPAWLAQCDSRQRRFARILAPFVLVSCRRSALNDARAIFFKFKALRKKLGGTSD